MLHAELGHGDDHRTDGEFLIYRGLLWALPIGVVFWLIVAAALWFR